MTNNQPSVIDSEGFSVRRTISIAAPVDKVWAAVTVPEHISAWFGRAAIDGSGAGALGTLTWEGRDPIPIRIEAVDEPRMISYSWSNELGSDAAVLNEERATVFTFTLEPVDGGTVLTVVETGFEKTSDPAANLEDHRGGWDAELDKLVALLEGGA